MTVDSVFRLRGTHIQTDLDLLSLLEAVVLVYHRLRCFLCNVCTLLHLPVCVYVCVCVCVRECAV